MPTTIEIPSTLSKNKRGKKFKEDLAAIIIDLGFSVEIEKPYKIIGNTRPIKLDIVVNSILSIETKLYMDTNMAYKYVAPMADIQTDNEVSPQYWAAICVQDANGFPWLQRHDVSCLAFEHLRRGKEVIELVHVNLTTLKDFIDASTSI